MCKFIRNRIRAKARRDAIIEIGELLREVHKNPIGEVPDYSVDEVNREAKHRDQLRQPKEQP